jgi:hypothetical protein
VIVEFREATSSSTRSARVCVPATETSSSTVRSRKIPNYTERFGTMLGNPQLISGNERSIANCREKPFVQDGVRPMFQGVAVEGATSVIRIQSRGRRRAEFCRGAKNTITCFARTCEIKVRRPTTG